MSYSRTTWIPEETPLSADNFNNIEDGIEESLNRLDAIASNTELLKAIYPVGSIYMSTSSTNPASYFGGTWVAWGSGRVPVGVNTSDTSFNTVEKTGGAKSHSYTPSGTNSGGSVGNHTLAISEMPSHSHILTERVSYTTTEGVKFIATPKVTKDNVSDIARTTTDTGGGGAHNHPFSQPTFTGNAVTMDHLQPYITCYMWKRTA